MRPESRKSVNTVGEGRGAPHRSGRAHQGTAWVVLPLSRLPLRIRLSSRRCASSYGGGVAPRSPPVSSSSSSRLREKPLVTTVPVGLSLFSKNPAHQSVRSQTMLYVRLMQNLEGTWHVPSDKLPVKLVIPNGFRRRFFIHRPCEFCATYRTTLALGFSRDPWTCSRWTFQLTLVLISLEN